MATKAELKKLKDAGFSSIDELLAAQAGKAAAPQEVKKNGTVEGKPVLIPREDTQRNFTIVRSSWYQGEVKLGIHTAWLDQDGKEAYNLAPSKLPYFKTQKGVDQLILALETLKDTLPES